MSITQYDMDAELDDTAAWRIAMTEHRFGDWVRYEDHCNAVDELRDEIRTLKLRIDELEEE